MSKKDTNPESTEDEGVVTTDSEEEMNAFTPAPPPPGVPRRAPGQKEVIPFAWKVCGYSFDGQTLTLFKSVELADSEAHLARLESEGYYEGLKVYPIDEKVPPSPLAKKRQAADARESNEKSKKSEVAKKEPEPAPAVIPPVAAVEAAAQAAVTSKAKKPSASKSAGKPVAKAAGKKKAAATKKAAPAKKAKKKAPAKKKSKS
jgi:hypothetical protein